MPTFKITLTDGAGIWLVSMPAPTVALAARTIEALIAHGHTISGMCGGVSTDNCGDLYDDPDAEGDDRSENDRMLDHFHEADITLVYGDEDAEDDDLRIISIIEA